MRHAILALRDLGLAAVCLAWALGLGGCARSLDRPSGSSFDWTAVRKLPAYDFTADSAQLRPVAAPGDYVLVREIVGAGTYHGERGDHQRLLVVPLVPGESLGFVAVDRYQGVAVAGDVEHPIRTTHGVEYTWCRESNTAEKINTTALDVVRATALFSAALGLAYLLDKWGLDDDDDDQDHQHLHH